MFEKINEIIKLVNFDTITEERQAVLGELINYIKAKRGQKLNVNLNFICTHNSRRSQFTQVWAKVAAVHYGIEVNTYSGGVEVTACNERTVASLKRFGFEVESKGEGNPKYSIAFSTEVDPIVAFSKLFDDVANPTSNFAAIMTCSHADENCPFVTGCDQRLPVRYNDPKAFDDSFLESTMYDSRSFEIAIEMFYVFSKI